MAFKIEWSEEAFEDIESIATYIEKDSPIYVKSVVLKFFEKAEILQEFSELGRKVPEFNDVNISEIFIYSYRLIYQLKEEKILFVTIVHDKRLLENHQQSIKNTGTNLP